MTMILIAYRHGLRALEVCDLQASSLSDYAACYDAAPFRS